MYSRRQGHLLKMKPLQLASILKIAELVGRSNLCSSKGVQIPPDRFTQMLEYCRDLRASGDLKKIWNMEPPALVKNPSLWTLKHICDRWGGFEIKKIRQKRKCPYPSQQCSLNQFTQWLGSHPALKSGFEQMFHISQPTQETLRIFLKGCRGRWLKLNKSRHRKMYQVSGPCWERLKN